MGGRISTLVVLPLLVSLLMATIPFPNSTLNSNPIFSNADSDDDGIENSVDLCPESPLPTWSNQSIESVLKCETCGQTGMDVKIDNQKNTHVVYSGSNQDSPNESEEGAMSFLKYAIHDGQYWNSSYASLVTEADYENQSVEDKMNGMIILDSIVESPLLQLDNNNLPHIVYYTYSGTSNNIIRNLRYATYQEMEIGAGYNWQKSTIIQGAAECGSDLIQCNDIAGFELDLNNHPHIVYRSVKGFGNSSNWSYESTLNYAISDDWNSWDTSRIYTAYNDSVSISNLIMDASMALDSQGKVNIIALTVSQEFNPQDDESQIGFEIIYLKFDGEDIIRSISISSANSDGDFDINYWKRTSLSITVDSEDLIHMGYINSLNQFTYAILEFNDISHSITTSIIDSAPVDDNDEPWHSYYDLALVIEPDGTPHALYTSIFGEYSLLPHGETLESLEHLEFHFYSFYSVLTDGEWNRLYIGGVEGLPGFTVNTNGLPTIIHSSHNFVNWTGLSLLNIGPIDSDDDGDGCMNFEDQFSSDSSEHIDSDGDGVGDNADVFPYDITEISDTDGDGVGDELDAFPTRITQWADYDGDGYGDNFANSSWNASFTMPGEYVPLAFKQDACPLLAGASYLGTQSNGELVIYGCPDTDGDGYADIIEFELTGPEQISEKGNGFSGIDLDLLGIILSLIIPVIAVTVGWYYSTRKRRSLKKLIEIIGTIDNLLDLTTWFDVVSTDGILNGEINHAQFELLQTHYKRHHDRLTSIRNVSLSHVMENK